MQTRTEYAAYIENNDFIVIDGEVKGYVYMVTDEESDYIHIDVVDDDGEHTVYPFAPFDEVTIVESFEYGDDWEKWYEDLDIED